MTARSLMRQRIIYERENSAAQSRFDPQDHRFARTRLTGFDGDPRFLGVICDAAAHLLTDRRHIDPMPRLSSVIHRRRHQKIFDHFAQSASVVDQSVQLSYQLERLDRISSTGQKLCASMQYGQWCAEFMRRIGDKSSLQLESLAQRPDRTP
ncbi:MAG: hypothetical protein L0G69_07980 [Brevibacterium sp.]|nr:hypothetical protein [Brevibacterium sp.]